MSPAGRSGPIVSLHFPPATPLTHRSIIKTSFVETTPVADAATTLPRRLTTATAKNRRTRISYTRYVKSPDRNKTSVHFWSHGAGRLASCVLRGFEHTRVAGDQYRCRLEAYGGFPTVERFFRAAGRPILSL